MEKRRYHIALGVIIVAALAIRLYAVRWDLPYTYWHDENNYIEEALRFGTGNFTMSTFSHGSLYQIILFLEYAGYYVISKIMGLISGPAGFFTAYLQDPSAFFMMARITVVACGAGMVGLVYAITTQIYNRRSALIAAIFTAFTFLMVQMSSVALADIPAVFILLLAALALVYSLEGAKLDKLYYLGAVLIGLAVACKYYTIFGISLLYVSAYTKTSNSPARVRSFLSLIIFGSIFVFIGFLIGMPFFLLGLSHFISDTFVRMGKVYILDNTHKNTWLFYFTNHLRNGLGIPLEIAALSGIAYAFYKRSRWDVLILSFLVAYYLFFMNSMGFAYHLLPAIPFALILAARVVDSFSKKFFSGKSSFACFFLSAIILLPTASDTFKFINISRGADTRTGAKVWIEQNIPEGSTIASEGYISTVAIHAPPLTADKKTLENDLLYVTAHKGSGRFIRAKIDDFDKLYGKDKKYMIYKADGLTSKEIDEIDSRYVILSGTKDAEALTELAYCLDKDYAEKRGELRRKVLIDYKLVKSFIPDDEFTPSFPHLMDRDYYLIRRLSFRKLHNYTRGPVIDVYEKRKQ